MNREHRQLLDELRAVFDDIEDSTDVNDVLDDLLECGSDNAMQVRDELTDRLRDPAEVNEVFTLKQQIEALGNARGEQEQEKRRLIEEIESRCKQQAEQNSKIVNLNEKYHTISLRWDRLDSDHRLLTSDMELQIKTTAFMQRLADDRLGIIMCMQRTMQELAKDSAISSEAADTRAAQAKEDARR